MRRTKKNKHNSSKFSLSGAPRGGAFGDKEIAVRICGNSHYRNSLSGQVGMLIGLCPVKVSWASGETKDNGYGRVSAWSFAPMEGAFILSFL